MRHVPARAESQRERAPYKVFVDKLLVRIHFVIGLVRWTGLAPWQFEFIFPGSLAYTLLE